MRTHLDLFSGIGGFALSARWAGVETIGLIMLIVGVLGFLMVGAGAGGM